MNVNGYRQFLKERNISSGGVESAITIVKDFECYLSRSNEQRTADTATAADAMSFSERLISENRNTFDHFLALLRYGTFSRNRALYVAMLELLDGAEAFGNLHSKIAAALGEAKRDEIFHGITLPPLGTPNQYKPALIQQVVARMEAVDHTVCKQIIGSGLRDLQDEWYQEAVTDFRSCQGIDEYLAMKSARFIAELEKHQKEGKWWFVQEITDDVLAYVREHPLVSGGIREGRVVYEVKIPYMAKEWLEETNPQMKRYLACHCPWVRESLRTEESPVSPTFCQCSAAFHRKPWEIIFGQPLHADVVESILNGDSQCKFAIHLPDSVA